MNKTITCNIGGMIFHIEESGYLALKNYLDQLKDVLKNQEGGDEIYRDIEARVAELFGTFLDNYKKAVLEDEVTRVIKQLGAPSAFMLDEDTYEQNSTSEDSDANRKVLMRDPEHGLIGGVCLGLSSYFGLDVVLVRAIFIFLTVLSGFGLGFYLILWVFTPKVTTVFDRLKMQGKPISANALKEEVKQAADRMEKYADKWYRQNKNTWGRLIRNITRIFSTILGVGFILGGVIGVVVFMTVALTNISLFQFDDNEMLLSLYTFSGVIFSNPMQGVLGWVGLFLVVLMPLFFLIIVGLSLFSKFKGVRFRNSLLVLFISWITGIAVLSAAGYQLSRSFEYTVDSEELLLNESISQLEIVVADTLLMDGNIRFKIARNNYSNSIFLKDDYVKIERIPIRIIETNDTVVVVRLEKQASGVSDKQSYKNLNNIQFDIVKELNRLIIPTYYSFPQKDKLRNQQVRLIIEIPNKEMIKWKGSQDNFNISVIQRNKSTL